MFSRVPFGLGWDPPGAVKEGRPDDFMSPVSKTDYLTVGLCDTIVKCRFAALRDIYAITMPILTVTVGEYVVVEIILISR